jgi:RND family efflux transporter MFP subunit
MSTRVRSFTHLLALLAIAAGTCATARAAQPPTWLVGSATTTERFEAPGQLEAVRQAELAAQAAGRVTAVLVRSGEAVRRGQVLLRIDSPGARAAAQAGSAQATAAASQLASSRADFKRAQQLNAKQYLSDAALQRAAAQLATVEAQASASSAQAQAAREAAGWDELRAPYDGRVTAVFVAVGDLAQAGQRLVGIYAPGPMRVLADVPADVAARLAIDRPLLLGFAAGACPLAPREVAAWTLLPSIDPGSRSVGVRVELPEARDCRPGALASLGLPLRGTGHRILIPASAVVRRGELSAAYVVDAGGGAWLRQLRLGASTGDMVEVLAGLEPGERVMRDSLSHRPAVAGADAPP